MRIIKQSFILEENREKIKDWIIKDIQNFFDTREEKEERKRLEKLERKKQDHNEILISNRIIRDIRTLFEQEDKDYLKPERINSFWNNHYIEYESNEDKSLSLNKYLNKIKTHLNNIIKDLQLSDAWKIQLTAAINFTFSKDTGKEHEMYSTSENIKFTSYNDVNDVVNKLFESLLSRYQDNLETSMRGSDFFVDSV